MQEFKDRGGLEQVEAFVAVAELGGFAAAASRIGRDASAISRRVNMLESHLGVRLLARTTRNVALTEAGRTYLRRVQAVLDELASANSEASEGAGIIRGALRVALPNTFGRVWIAPLLPKFIEAFPEVHLEIRFDDRYVDLVSEGFDIAIRVGVLQSSSLISRRIARRRTILCASPAYLKRNGTPRAPEDLVNHDCIGFSGHSFWPDWPLQKGLQRKTVKPKGALVSDNAEANLLAAISGVGIVLSADWLAGSALKSGKLVEVLPGWTVGGEGGVYVVMPPGKLIPAKTRAFSDFIAAELRAGADWSNAKRTVDSRIHRGRP